MKKEYMAIMLFCFGTVYGVKNSFFDLDERVFNASVAIARGSQCFPAQKDYVLEQLAQVKMAEDPQDKCIKMSEFMNGICASWKRIFDDAIKSNAMILTLRKVGLESKKAELVNCYSGDEARVCQENADYMHEFKEKFGKLTERDLLELKVQSFDEVCESFARILPSISSVQPFLIFDNKESISPYFHKLFEGNSKGKIF